jgi:hypothetical protein
MRGDQLARLWRLLWTFEASFNGLASAEISMPDEAQRCGQNQSPSKACSKRWDGLFYYGAALKRLFGASLAGQRQGRGIG